MKILTLANQKGGTGKTAIACQYAFFENLVKQKRVLLIDADHQGNTSNAVGKSGMAQVADFTADAIFSGGIKSLPEGDFVLVPAGYGLRNLEKQPDKHNSFVGSMNAFLKGVSEDFDICIIDTNPNPDIRMTCSLVLSDYVLSPVQLNQEAIDGIGDLKRDLDKIKKTLNPKLEFIGILPNIVEPTPFQRENLAQISKAFLDLMISMDSGGVAAIPKRSAIAEAQAANSPVWTLKKTSARDTWNVLKPVFEQISKNMEG